MSIFTELAKIGSKSRDSNVEQMLTEDDDSLLVQMPRSKYMLKCNEREDNQWEIVLIDPHTMDSMVVHDQLPTKDFQSLLFNLFSIQLEEPNMLYHAVKEEYRSLHR